VRGVVRIETLALDEKTRRPENPVRRVLNSTTNNERD
jgi:hypothetical protein